MISLTVRRLLNEAAELLALLIAVTGRDKVLGVILNMFGDGAAEFDFSDFWKEKKKRVSNKNCKWHHKNGSQH